MIGLSMVMWLLLMLLLAGVTGLEGERHTGGGSLCMCVRAPYYVICLHNITGTSTPTDAFSASFYTDNSMGSPLSVSNSLLL